MEHEKGGRKGFVVCGRMIILRATNMVGIRREASYLGNCIVVWQEFSNDDNILIL